MQQWRETAELSAQENEKQRSERRGWGDISLRQPLQTWLVWRHVCVCLITTHLWRPSSRSCWDGSLGESPQEEWWGHDCHHEQGRSLERLWCIQKHPWNLNLPRAIPIVPTGSNALRPVACNCDPFNCMSSPLPLPVRLLISSKPLPSSIGWTNKHDPDHVRNCHSHHWEFWAWALGVLSTRQHPKLLKTKVLPNNSSARVGAPLGATQKKGGQTHSAWRKKEEAKPASNSRFRPLKGLWQDVVPDTGNPETRDCLPSGDWENQTLFSPTS